MISVGGDRMEYTVQKLARLAGVSPRTLRHYDQIGLLKPARISSSGYRIYGPKEVELLQQILLYRALEFPLEDIRTLLYAADFDALTAFRTHRDALAQRRAQIDGLIANVTHTIAHMEGGITMGDQDRFEGFRAQLIEGNEAKYGEEIRAQYGDAAIDASNARLRGMTKASYDAAQQMAAEANEALLLAMDAGNPAGIHARRAVELHRKWLGNWGEYSDGMHVGLGRMYVEDERFAAHYDALRKGAAVFLRDAIEAYYAQ